MSASEESSPTVQVETSTSQPADVAGAEDREDHSSPLTGEPEAPGEPLTKRELQAWYTFDWACSVYSTVSISLFMPLLIVGMAEDYAWNRTYSGASRIEKCEDLEDGVPHEDCLFCETGEGSQMRWGPLYQGDVPDTRLPSGIDPVSYATTMTSISVILQAVTFIATGPSADYRDYRYKQLVVWTWVGSITCVLFLAAHKDSLYWLAGALLIISNIAYGCANVFYNAYLPILVDADPQVAEAKRSLSPAAHLHLRDQIENRYSQTGFAWGYFSGVLLLTLCAALAFTIPGMTMKTFCRMSVALSGIWWLGFSLFSFKYLKVRPGSSLPKNKNIFLEGLKDLYGTVRSVKAFPNTLKFLLIYFVYSDGVSTISTIGVLFAQRDICMDTSGLIFICILVPLSALLGNLFFTRFQHRLGIQSKHMLLINLVCLALLPLYGSLGWLTPKGGLGLKSEWEMYMFSAVYGFNLGSVQSYSRTVYADLIPVGKEAQLFSLYEITDKGSSWMGPLLTGVVVQATDSLRMCNIYLLVTLVLPVAFIYFSVDHHQGMVDAGRISPTSDRESEFAELKRPDDDRVNVPLEGAATSI